MDHAKFQRPDRPSKCTWSPGNQNSPHSCRSTLKDDWKCISPHIMDAIGNTPLVRLNKIPVSEGIECEVLGKCEFLNPGGSVKDRIAYRMYQDAKDAGLINKDTVIIEHTSGNTGIGLAMVCAAFGHRCIIVMPAKNSKEKRVTMEALGAEIVITPTEAAFDSPEGLIAVAQQIQHDIPNSIILNQYTNPGNPLSHYDGTGAEIVAQCGGKLDAVVVGAGTGGTATGIARYLKDHVPGVKVYGVDPHGSILALPPDLNDGVYTYAVEGIGYDFIPTVLDRSVIDKWIKSNDKEAFLTARRLIKEEGLLCGGSSGAAMSVALKIAKTMERGQRIVAVLPDGIRNYMTKMVDDNWLIEKGFLE